MFRACVFEELEDLDKGMAVTAVKKQKQKKQELAKLVEDTEKLGLNDRVFVCLGSLDLSNKPHAWVMTIDKNYS
jgi:hypothetical protein